LIIQAKNKTKNKLKSKHEFKSTWNGVPAVAKWPIAEQSLYESFVASIFWHVIGALLLWGITFSFMFFGITPKLFPTPKPKIHDIEFIIKNPSRHRTHYPKIEAKQSTIDTDKMVNIEANKVNSDTKPTDSAHQNMSQSSSPSGKNTMKSKSGTHSKSESSDFSIPMPNLKSLSSGLGGSGRTRNHTTGSQASNSSVGGIDNAFSTSKGVANRSGFDKSTTRKIITTYDISPYVNELKRNVRWNWKAPTNNGNKRVELFLRIAKDGRVIILNVKRTSEVGEVDNAALNAVKKSLPLNPLPAKYNKSYLDIIFTFDSNSIGSRY